MYLPSFYKLQFEKYFFNIKRAGMFGIPVVLWGNHLFLIQSYGHSILNSTILSIQISFHQPEVSKEESPNNDADYK